MGFDIIEINLVNTNSTFVEVVVEVEVELGNEEKIQKKNSPQF